MVTRATTRTQRTHSREFKLQVVREAAAGQKRPSQLAREYGITDSLLCKWRKEYERQGDAAWTAQAQREPPTLGLEQQVAALERFCGQLAWENAELKKALRHRAPSRSATP